jgi:hypothetical protein
MLAVSAHFNNQTAVLAVMRTMLYELILSSPKIRTTSVSFYISQAEALQQPLDVF